MENEPLEPLPPELEAARVKEFDEPGRTMMLTDDGALELFDAVFSRYHPAFRAPHCGDTPPLLHGVPKR